MRTATTFPVRHVSVSIARAPRDVYAFVADPHHLSRWASGLGSSIRDAGGGAWAVDAGPLGQAIVRFAPGNDLGVLDHDVTLASGETVHNALRVLPNGTGAEIVFSVFRTAGVSEADFARDAATIEHDLRTLKALLEA